MDYKDVCQLNTAGIVKKKKGFNNKTHAVDLNIVSSVSGNILIVKCPDENLEISLRLQDVVDTLTLSNEAYKAIKKIDE